MRFYFKDKDLPFPYRNILLKLHFSRLYYKKHLTKVFTYCLLGGWTRIGKAVQDGSLPDKSFIGSEISGGIASLRKTNQFLLTPSGFKELRDIISFTQLRVYCHKPSHGRTIHIVTVNNYRGYDVLDYLSGLTDTQPASCGSYIRVNNDKSILASTCGMWGETGLWGSLDSDQLIRLYDHFFYISYKAHINLKGGGRLECDDFYGYPGFSTTGVWQFFVR
ncbi:uncharacterized protein LOC130647075 isoform X1 [Hydractinia symbiolongicarpus]|uniref:uncharacterized protein LOC130647075 isoform X1 n=1 Tax=Hydractinia symbiolongicarpus TaxID=13093 RepID=UPI00254AC51D|nr:uncharacterized protein LOC130647075 isoform X1 [Hydractinia symbiolongicarpus]XP_057308782.1 uncharacterized protein LOC130647075 isoform X1 [Hydractinia symbiolongicarpus]